MKRLGMIMIALILLALLGAAGWYLGSPLLLDKRINEALPFTLPYPTAVMTQGANVQSESVQSESAADENVHTNENEDVPAEFPATEEIGSILPSTEVPIEFTPTAEAAPEEATTTLPSVEVILLPTPTATPVPEATATPEVVANAPANGPLVIEQGQFVDGDSFHKGSGNATLFQLPDAGYLLRLDDFVVTNGPDLRVLLSTNPMPTDHASLDNYLDLGSLKGNIGDQNYTASLY